MERVEEKTEQNFSKNVELFNRFEKERGLWKESVVDMSNRLSDIYKVSDLLTDLYSQRQVALEYAHNLQSLLIQLNRTYRQRRVERWDYYTKNYDLRMDKEPKELHINVDLANLVERKDMLQNHLDYMRQTITSIDTICYGIKHRVSLEEYKRGING